MPETTPEIVLQRGWTTIASKPIGVNQSSHDSLTTGTEIARELTLAQLK
jgi:hypothetical protein